MSTNSKTDADNSKPTSSANQNQQSGLMGLLNKLNGNPKAAEAMKQALAKTREELKNNETD